MTDSQQPAVVLVHGAFAGASGFGGVIRELARSGYRVIAPPNPLRSLAFDAAAVSAVITQASSGLDNVAGLVYLAAFGLDAGESCASVQEPFPPSLAALTEKATAVGWQDRPG
jgi:hypothetical protein